jgi:hypothetical protein
MIGKISNINDIFSNRETQFLFLHRYLYGGGTTFTAHLLHTMGLTRKGRKRFISLLSLETAVADAAAPYY